MSDTSSKVPFLPDNISCKIELAVDASSGGTEEVASSRSGGSIERFRSIAQAFVTYLQVLWQYAHEIGSVAERTSLTNLAQIPELLQEIEKRQKRASSGEKPVASIVFTAENRQESKQREKSFPVFEFEHVRKLNECLTQHTKALRLLNETVLQQMVNAWERVLGDLLAWKLNADPDALPKNRTISLSEVMSFSDFEEVHRHVVEGEVADFLKSKTTLEQIKYFKDEFGADLKSHFPAVDELCEIVLRRHAVVHARGIASSEYCRRVSKLKKLRSAPPEKGKPLVLDAGYIRRAWSVIFSAGVILTHLVARTHARDKHCKKDEKTADSFLVNAAFNGIKSKQYEAAIFVLEYAHALRLASTSSDLMVLVNLAQAHKWSGDDEKCLVLLDEHDWGSCSANFRLCVAALREDCELLRKELEVAAREGTVGIAELHEWPVFQKVRCNEDFTTVLKSTFGEDAIIPARGEPAKLLNFGADFTMSELLKGIVGKMSELPQSSVKDEEYPTSECS
jgi:hypothetical protein